MKREINFRLGNGRLTERKKVFNLKSVIAAMKYVGMSDVEIRKALAKQRATREGEGR